MARETSKRNGGRNGKARGSGSSNRKRATRPPIIDVSATEIPVSEASQSKPQAGDRAAGSTQAHNFAELSANLWDEFRNKLGGGFSQFPNIMMWPQKYFWFAGVAGLVIIASIFALLSEPAPKPDMGPNFQTVMQQRLAGSEKQIADLSRQLSAMDVGLRADIAKNISQQDDRVKAQTDQFAKMAVGQEALAARLGTLERALQATNDQFERQFKSIASSIDEMRKLTLEAQINAKNADAALKTVQQRLAKLEAIPQPKPVPAQRVSKAPLVTQVENFKTAGVALIMVLQTQNGFADRLSAYAKTAPDDPAVALLRPYAENGAPLIEQLLVQAETFAKPTDVAAPKIEKSEQTGLADKVVNWSKTFVRVRRKSDKSQDGNIQADAWAKIAAHLKTGRLEDGLALALALPGGKMHDDWVKQAEGRLLIDRQIKSLQAKLDALQTTDPQPRKGG